MPLRNSCLCTPDTLAKGRDVSDMTWKLRVIDKRGQSPIKVNEPDWAALGIALIDCPWYFDQ